MRFVASYWWWVLHFVLFALHSKLCCHSATPHSRCPSTFIVCSDRRLTAILIPLTLSTLCITVYHVLRWTRRRWCVCLIIYLPLRPDHRVFFWRELVARRSTLRVGDWCCAHRSGIGGTSAAYTFSLDSLPFAPSMICTLSLNAPNTESATTALGGFAHLGCR